jgi:hypothetical protein
MTCKIAKLSKKGGKGILASNTVYGQTASALERFHRPGCARAKDPIETVGAVTTANKSALKHSGNVTASALPYIDASCAGLRTPDSVNGKTSTALTVKLSLKSLHKTLLSVLTVNAVYGLMIIVVVIAPLLYCRNTRATRRRAGTRVCGCIIGGYSRSLTIGNLLTKLTPTTIIHIICWAVLTGSVIVTHNMIGRYTELVHQIGNEFAKICNLLIRECAASVDYLDVDRVRVCDAIATVTVTDSPGIVTACRVIVFPDAIVIYKIVGRCIAVATSKILAVVNSRCSSRSIMDVDILDAYASARAII